MGDQSTKKLILHQASSIFLGSGSLGRCSLDTRKTVCTSRPHGGLYGKKRLRSPPASLLQAQFQDKDSVICIIYYLNPHTVLFVLKMGEQSCFLVFCCFFAPPKLNTRGNLYEKRHLANLPENMKLPIFCREIK